MIIKLRDEASWRVAPKRNMFARIGKRTALRKRFSPKSLSERMSAFRTKRLHKLHVKMPVPHLMSSLILPNKSTYQNLK